MISTKSVAAVRQFIAHNQSHSYNNISPLHPSRITLMVGTVRQIKRDYRDKLYNQRHNLSFSNFTDAANKMPATNKMSKKYQDRKEQMLRGSIIISSTRTTAATRCAIMVMQGRLISGGGTVATFESRKTKWETFSKSSRVAAIPKCLFRWTF